MVYVHRSTSTTQVVAQGKCALPNSQPSQNRIYIFVVNSKNKIRKKIEIEIKMDHWTISAS